MTTIYSSFFIRGGYMKSLKEFKPLIKLIGQDKNKLVLAVVRDYISKNQAITCNELKTIFDKSLQGSIGVVEYEHIAKQRKDYQVRFFTKEDEILQLNDGNMLLCSQWGVLNISNFIKRAEQLGYKIEQIIRE